MSRGPGPVVSNQSLNRTRCGDEHQAMSVDWRSGWPADGQVVLPLRWSPTFGGHKVWALCMMLCWQLAFHHLGFPRYNAFPIERKNCTCQAG